MQAASQVRKYGHIPVSTLAFVLVAIWQQVCHLAFTLAAAIQSHLTTKCHLAVGAAHQLKVASVSSVSASFHPAPMVATAAAAVAASVIRRCSLLPSRYPHQKNRLTVVLDLDETLVCTYRLDQMSAWKQQAAPSCGACWVHYGSQQDTSSTLVVYERPGCREFLQQLSTFADLVLFTAAAAAYAQPLASLLDPHGDTFIARLYRDSTIAWGGKYRIKDLSALGRDLSQVVLVDNSPYSFLLQPSNGIPCIPYHGEAKDMHLLHVILPLLEVLSEVDDIRPILHARFGMAAWFKSKGIQMPGEGLH